jgi:hypothetical protein
MDREVYDLFMPRTRLDYLIAAGRKSGPDLGILKSEPGLTGQVRERGIPVRTYPAEKI